MHFDRPSPTPSSHSSPACYFSIVPSPSDHHFSDETPSTTPLLAYSSETYSLPSNPLLALRPQPFHLDMSPQTMDGSKLLQLQTSVAHRPEPQPVQHRSSPCASDSSSDSSSASSSLQELTCVRCRRTAIGSMINVGTSLYYCRHCAQMVGYGTG